MIVIVLYMRDRCDFSQLLARYHLRPTPLRLEVLEILGASPRPCQAREILEAVRTERPANKVTIYRILEDFVQRGFIHRSGPDGSSSQRERRDPRKRCGPRWALLKRAGGQRMPSR